MNRGRKINKRNGFSLLMVLVVFLLVCLAPFAKCNAENTVEFWDVIYVPVPNSEIPQSEPERAIMTLENIGEIVLDGGKIISAVRIYGEGNSTGKATVGSYNPRSTSYYGEFESVDNNSVAIDSSIYGVNRDHDASFVQNGAVVRDIQGNVWCRVIVESDDFDALDISLRNPGPEYLKVLVDDGVASSGVDIVQSGTQYTITYDSTNNDVWAGLDVQGIWRFHFDDRVINVPPDSYYNYSKLVVQYEYETDEGDGGDGDNDNGGTYTSGNDDTGKSSSFCFIATAAYGTPMAQEVKVLCRLRDEYLLSNSVGTRLVHLYYRTSPPVAEFIRRHPMLKKTVRGALKPVVWMVSNCI